MAAKTNGDIYKLINDLRLEVKGDLKELTEKVEKIDTAQAVSSTKIGMIVAGIALVVSAIVSALISQLRGRVV